ncbi:hypothetical protein [Streptomyces sp. NPDC005752]|uniref:hypothetical protein n=1 Tax=Streptomyces sp. NPDC005752 TaxID=3157065 RepID=UPI0033FF9155
MMHTSGSLTVELHRLRDRPGAESAPPVLSRFVVHTYGDAAEYEQRLRSVLMPALRLGGTADFEQESLPVDDVPDWFGVIGSEDEERAPQFARTGRDGYVEHMEESRPWELQDWLYRFDPDEDSRGWEWWDATQAGPSRVHIWVDSWGESFFGCRELLWAAYAAGAARVDGPTLQKSAVWSAERGLARADAAVRGLDMRSNARMRALLRETGTAGPSPQDIPPVFREVVERGWSVTPAGGRVLTDLLPENLPRYSDRLAEETTVNGRGMTDHDLPSATDERAPLLVRRCLAYVAACLHGAQEHFGDTAVKSYVSLSFADTDEALLTANVTFCTPLPDVRPYIPDLEDVTDAAVAEFSAENCSCGSRAVALHASDGDDDMIKLCDSQVRLIPL